MVITMQQEADRAELAAEVEARLYHYEPLRTAGDMLEFDLLPGGVLELRGPVRTRVIRDEVLTLVGQIPGINQVVDGLIADPDLELAIAEAFASDTRTRSLLPGRIFVRSHLGQVTLYGWLPEGISREALHEIVDSVPGVRVVIDRLEA